MGLLSLILVAAFTLLYLSAAMPKKPPAMEKALVFINENLNYLAMGGLVFGFIAVLITPLGYFRPIDIFSRMFADGLLMFMALPYAFPKLVALYGSKINAAIMKELNRLMAWITAHGPYFGGLGVVACILLFATIFR